MLNIRKNRFANELRLGIHRSEAVHICHVAAQSPRIRGEVRPVKLSSAADVSDLASVVILILGKPLPPCAHSAASWQT
jgi:hypothetical protein